MVRGTKVGNTYVTTIPFTTVSNARIAIEPALFPMTLIFFYLRIPAAFFQLLFTAGPIFLQFKINYLVIQSSI